MVSIRYVLPLIGFFPLVSHAGLAITLIPSPDMIIGPGSWYYEPGQIVHVDVYGQLTGGDETPASLRLRLLQFDFSDTSSEISINLLPTHTDTAQGDISFWNFGTTPVCMTEPGRCGENYFIDDLLDSDDLLNVTYLGLTSDGSRQITLHKSVSTLIGAFEFTMPPDPGTYVIDLLNADETDSNQGAELRAGFSVIGLGTLWRASDGEITGGRLYTTIPEPGTLLLLLLGALSLHKKAK